MAAEIRTLSRGLALLEAANLQNGGRLRDFAAATGLPKPTVLRLLESLRAAGYLQRTPGEERYFLALRVRRLSDGFTDASWITTVARPQLLALSARIGFPVAISTPYGAAMMLRDNTDADTPASPNVYARGTLLPLLTSATGKVYLAFCDEVSRRALLDACAASPLREHALARQPGVMAAALAQVRRQGHAFGPGAGKTRVAQETATLAVPIRSRQNLFACLAMRYLSAGVSRDLIVERYLGALQRAARAIAAGVAGSDVSRIPAPGNGRGSLAGP
jgi:IclR family mhp operon transcriptional activator